MTAKRSRKRRSDAIYPDAAARQRAYRARRRAKREAKLIPVIKGLNVKLLVADRPLLAPRPDARFYGLLGNAVKKAKRAENEEGLTEAKVGPRVMRMGWSPGEGDLALTEVSWPGP